MPAAIFTAFLRLGLTSFGGPVAHVGFFRTAFVIRRRWLSEAAFAETLALCQVLPGPTSSQLGMAIGLSRGGWAGMIAAWAGFTLPSAVAMIAVAGSLARIGGLHGLALVALAVVAQAVWGMARQLCPERRSRALALAAAGLAVAVAGPAGQVGSLALGAAAGGWLPGAAAMPPAPRPTVPTAIAAACLTLFVAMLALTVVVGDTAGPWARLLAAIWRAGSLVFGGGHVVLPLLQAATVPPGWISRDVFLAGYGAAQAVPGPLFTFAAFLGAVSGVGPGGWLGGAAALAAIFLPSFLLVAGAMPVWTRLRGHPAALRAVRGINAAVVGVLLAALVTTLRSGVVTGPFDLIVVVVALGLLVVRVPPWAVVLIGAGVG